jgi:hypothetical protein
MRYSLIPAALLAASLVGAVPTTPSLDTLGSQGLIPSVAERVYDSVHKWWSSGDVSGEDIYQGIKVGSVHQDGVLCTFSATDTVRDKDLTAHPFPI